MWRLRHWFIRKIAGDGLVIINARIISDGETLYVERYKHGTAMIDDCRFGTHNSKMMVLGMPWQEYESSSIVDDD